MYSRSCPHSSSVCRRVPRTSALEWSNHHEAGRSRVRRSESIAFEPQHRRPYQNNVRTGRAIQPLPDDANRAPRQYGKWLSDDVAYIITAQERERFLALTSDSERDQFIQQFWLAHDPSTGANANKFKEEHYRRIRYANERFGHDIPGRQTDRGRAYIVLGPPDEIDAHPADGWQSWRYQKLDGTADRLELTFATPRSQ